MMKPDRIATHYRESLGEVMDGDVDLRSVVHSGAAAFHQEASELLAELRRFRVAFQNDIKSLRTHFCWLLLAQTVLIVGLVLGLERLL